ncbi:MAG: hypothetical protein GQ565_11210 [Candidatus Aegiribacteria sp.]|nr:hypothetical protein [Candidatus Aegiribacteria sp.]
MALFRKREVSCPAGRWTTLISNFGSGMPKTFTIAFHTESHGEISGEFLEKKYFWIFPQKPVRGPLVPLMEFKRDWINGIYTVKVKPDIDLIAEFK